MSRLFRSEDMSLYQIIMEYETAYYLTAEIGEAGIVEFRNVHQESDEKYFLRELEICVEIEKKLTIMKSEIDELGIEFMRPNKKVNIARLKAIFNSEAPGKFTDEHNLNVFWKMSREWHQGNINRLLLQRDYWKWTELLYILMKTEYLFDKDWRRSSVFQPFKESLFQSSLFRDEPVGTIKMINGSVINSRVNAFRTVVWRVSMGNVLLVIEDTEEPQIEPNTGIIVTKSIFFMVFFGDALEEKLIQVCNCFNAYLYECPMSLNERIKKKEEVWIKMRDIQDILLEAEIQRRVILEQVAEHIIAWEIKVKKAKAVFHTMNMFHCDEKRKVFFANFWIPDTKLDQFHQLLTDCRDLYVMRPLLIKIQPDEGEMPPVYHSKNKVTESYQNLVDAYGPNCYKELNPVPFTVITFPFLFSVMFGDFGHGLIIVFVAACLILFEKSLEKSADGEISKIFFKGRYLILLMGLFSVHAGILYNDIFSMCIRVFKTSWVLDTQGSSVSTNNSLIDLDPEKNFKLHPYPYGMDPMWCIAREDVLIKNSLKMKMSIIFGVIHMFFGILIGIFNICYFKKYSEIITTFIPQVIFMTSLFVYLCVLIFLKWVEFGPLAGPEKSSSCAPSILNMFLAVVMFMKVEYSPGCDSSMYPHQEIVERFLMIVAIICIPWLFLVHPLYEIWKLRRKSKTPTESCNHQHGTDDCEGNIRGVESGTHHNHTNSGNVTQVPGSSTITETGETHNQQDQLGEINERQGVHSRDVQPGDDSDRNDNTDKKIDEKTEQKGDTTEKSKETSNSVSAKTDVVEKAALETRVTSTTTITEKQDTSHARTSVTVCSLGEQRCSVSIQQRKRCPIKVEKEHQPEYFELFVHQSIHAIEFILGSVSNTASYLRLWALSLAHEELSHVIWSQVLRIALTLQTEYAIIRVLALYLLFIAWAGLTVAILVLMEGLSAFLHTLRLHWIEFQSKFYLGNGHNFHPFDFKNVLKEGN